MTSTKNSGQFFTPNYLVKIILDFGGYTTQEILQKHIIDNSCGNGAFLTEIVERYCRSFMSISNDKSKLKNELETYIHGIEIDSVAYASCLQNLDSIVSHIGLKNVAWDIKNTDTLSTDIYNGKMDFVVGNPPYVRVHNLENYSAVKQFKFAAKGMVDLFIVFFEVGFRMLSPTGTMCIITPSSWLSSKAGDILRKHIKHYKNLTGIIDLEHFQPFNATTYTLISRFENNKTTENVDYYTFNGELTFREHLSYSEIIFPDGFRIASHKALKTLRTIRQLSVCKYVSVKNGFATLADKIFISDFDFEEGTIRTIKASTGKWTKCIFPYDKNCKPLPIDSVQQCFPEVYKHLLCNKDTLLKRDSDSGNWHLFGRTQALNDVFKNKIAINSILKDIDSIKLNRVKAGEGVYSGLYILTNIDFETIKRIVKSEQFVEYIKLLKNYKSGGYYTFSSKDLELFINYKLQGNNE